MVQAKVDRAQGGSTIVCVSDRWTLEFDLALYGCAELMFTAIHLAKKADSRKERLTLEDEVKTTAEAKELWEKLTAEGHPPVKLATIIYQPLVEKDASKAVTAQYAAYLISTGAFGRGKDLLKQLPPYLQRAFAHLTGFKVEA